MSNKSRFIEGVIVGVVVGVVAGALIPSSKTEEVKRKVTQLKDDHSELIDDAKDKTATVVNKALFAIEEGFDKLMGFLEDKTIKDDDKDKTTTFTDSI